MFDSWQSFWHMGGYGPYVWSAYGVTAIILLINGYSASRKLKKIRKKLQG